MAPRFRISLRLAKRAQATVVTAGLLDEHAWRFAGRDTRLLRVAQLTIEQELAGEGVAADPIELVPLAIDETAILLTLSLHHY